jgi:serine/threonine protein kinase
MAKIYGNRWKLIESINAGGQGDVFRVTDESKELSGEWALKRLRRKDRVARFRQEVEILKRLQHDNIIKLVDAEVQQDGGDEASFLVMPIAQHGDLDARLGIYTGHIDSIAQVAKQIASALEYAHKSNVIHRDIKPGNILFPDVGHKVWVADFGLSLDQGAERNTLDREVVGPRFFIAPELDEGGALNVTPAADIYSLGQLIFYMLTAGKRVARENVFDERYGEFFAKGQRHGLLRLLLSKMIALKENRYTEMGNVVRELEQIENWEQRAAGGLLNPKGLAATARLQKRMAEEMERQETFETVREGELKRIASVKSSILAWMADQLEATKVQLEAGDKLVVRVVPDEQNANRPVQVDTGNDTLLEERASAAISVRLPNDARRATYTLRLIVCAELRYTLPPTHTNYLGVPGNPMMAVLPMFAQSSEHSPHLNSEAGYFLGEPTKYGVPNRIPLTSAPPHYRQMIDNRYLDGNMAIARFNAADWPAAQHDVLKMMTDSLSRMMDYVLHQNP